MLRLINYEEIKGSLAKLNALVDIYDKKDFSFPAKVKNWIKNIEEILENNKLIIASDIGACRAMLIAAEQGVVPMELNVGRNATKRKLLQAVASHVLQKSGQMVSDYLKQDQQRFADAEKLVRQLVVFMQTKGMLLAFDKNLKDTESLKNIWQLARSDSDLIQLVVNVETLVDKYDALIILNRALIVAD